MDEKGRKYRSASAQLPETIVPVISRAKSFHQTGSDEELVQCGICMDKLSEPRMLPCQHTFCLGCLETVCKKSDALKCPICQTKFEMADGLGKLPRNLYIDSLLQVLGHGSPKIGADACISCQNAENSLKNCKHCKQVFCATCWPEHITKLKNSFTYLTDQLNESQNRLKHRLQDFHERCGKITTNIKRTSDQKISKIKSAEEANLTKLKQIENHENGSAELIEKSIKDLKHQLNSVGFEGISDEDKVKHVIDFNRRVNKILNETAKWGEARVIFDPKTFKLSYSNEFVEKPGAAEEDVTDSVAIINPLESTDTLSRFYRKKSSNPKLVWTKCPRPAGVGVPPWDPHLLYIAATDRKVVLIMDRYISKIIGKLSAPDVMLCPHGLAFCTQRMEIFITDKWNHCVHVFSHEGVYERTLCSIGGGGGELRSPEGIAINSKCILVCDTGNDRVVLLDPMDGQQISILGMSSNTTEFCAPTGIAVHANKIIIADNGNHRIKIFSEAGKKLDEFGSVGKEKGQFASAEVVTCDPMGFILVGDSGNARIQIFDTDLKLVRVIGGYGESPGKFSWISGLTVTPQLEIIATDYKNRRLQIF